MDDLSATLSRMIERDALLNNAFELLMMKPPSTWTTPERAFAQALDYQPSPDSEPRG